MMPSDSLRLVKALAWDEVFALWRDGEANIPRWIEHYTKGGFRSWDDWRRNTLRDVRYENLSWKLFDIENPVQTVPCFFGGPFRVWIKNYYDGARTRTFEELSRSRRVQNNAIVNEMIANFPATTHLVGLEVDNKIFVIEGMGSQPGTWPHANGLSRP